jgi:hypothetical protein
MAVQYRHRQRGTVALAALAAVTAFYLILCVWIGASVPKTQSGLLLSAIAVLIILAPLAWYLSSMTVVVANDELRWHFGFGRGWRIARLEIESTTIAPHRWIGGYGVRWYGPERWVYIVSGRDTVEVRLKQGGWRRLGTDDPQGLLKALSSNEQHLTTSHA